MTAGPILGLDAVANAAYELGRAGIDAYIDQSAVRGNFSGMDGRAADHAVERIGVGSDDTTGPQIARRGRTIERKALADQLLVAKARRGELSVPLQTRDVVLARLIGGLGAGPVDKDEAAMGRGQICRLDTIARAALIAFRTGLS